MSPAPFADRLAALVEERQSQLCLGLDPDPSRLDPGSTAAEGSAAERAGEAVAAHCRSLIERAGSACVAAKLQLACFERLGAPGWAALERTVDAARQAGLMVIADGKRGDVPVSAAAYAQALFTSTPTPWGDVAGLGADAATVSPLIGDRFPPTPARGSRGGRRGAVRTGAHLQSRWRPIYSTCPLPRRPCSSAWPPWWPSALTA